MSALPKSIQLELRETFLFVAAERGLDAAIAAVAILGEQLGRCDRVHDELSQLIGTVALMCGVDQSLILGRARHFAASEPRQIAMWVAYRRGYSTVQIGAALNRDHTTVLHGLHMVDRTPSLLARAEQCLQAMSAQEAA